MARWLAQQGSFGAGDIIQCRISEGGHWRLAAWEQMSSELAQERTQRAGIKGRRLCQPGVGTGSRGTMVGWQTRRTEAMSQGRAAGRHAEKQVLGASSGSTARMLLIVL